MGPKMRRNFSGAFLARDCGNGAWQLTRAAPHEMDVFLRDAERGAAHAFGTVPIVDLPERGWHFLVREPVTTTIAVTEESFADALEQILEE